MLLVFAGQPSQLLEPAEVFSLNSAKQNQIAKHNQFCGFSLNRVDVLYLSESLEDSIVMNFVE